MHFGVIATGKLDGRGTSECLQAGSIPVALPITASRRGANRLPARGKLAKISWSG
jgi:hypothetical protein